jgi:ABC-type sugar transport system permease subunit
MQKRVFFRNWWLPYAWSPADRHNARLLHLARLPGAGILALYRGRVRFFAHIRGARELRAALLATRATSASFWTTLVFGLSVTVISMGMALALAAAANRVIRTAPRPTARS